MKLDKWDSFDARLPDTWVMTVVSSLKDQTRSPVDGTIKTDLLQQAEGNYLVDSQHELF